MATIPKRDLNRIYSGLRPFIVDTIQALIGAGALTGSDTPALATPLPHGETHELFAEDELRVDNVSTLCVNRTGVTIPIHSVVYVDDVGFDEDRGESRPAIDLADSTDSTKLPPLGITREEILDDEEGLVVRLGRVEGVDADTPGWTTPDALYLDPSTPGGLTSTLPTTGVIYRIATVLADETSGVESQSQGELLIAIENLTDVVGPTSGFTITTINGQEIATVIDTTRSNKVLSISEAVVQWSAKHMNSQDHLRIGEARGDDIGFDVPLTATLVRASLVTEDNRGNARNIDLYVNGSLNTAAILAITGSPSGQENVRDITLNIDLAQGDIVHLRGNSGSKVDDVHVALFFKWRG